MATHARQAGPKPLPKLGHELLAHAPTTMAELPAWFEEIGIERTRSVASAVIMEFVMFDEWSCPALAAAITAATRPDCAFTVKSNKTFKEPPKPTLAIVGKDKRMKRKPKLSANSRRKLDLARTA
jgi:hypothetical protein